MEKQVNDQDKEQGYKVCECGHGVHLLQAGFEIDLHSCEQCGEHVADKDDFFKINDGSEFLSK